MNVTDRQTDRITVAIPRYALWTCNAFLGDSLYKNSSGDEIANVNFFTTSHM